MCGFLPAAVHSGKASVEWITASGTCEAAQPVQTAVRLVLDEGWHTYWTNPGESGMKTSVTWELPAGWTAGELENPVPKRFMTGELPGFGYEGTVVFPVKLTPPADFTGEAKLKGKISWLTCNDSKCVPGNATLELSLKLGAPVATEEMKWIHEALVKIPRPNPEITLNVTEKPKSLILTLASATTKPFNPGDYEVFPATPQAVDSAAKFVFASEGNGWKAEVPKSEYASDPLKSLTLVLAGKGVTAPFSVTWSEKNENP